MSLIDVPAGQLATVVTYLAMDRPPTAATVPPSPLALTPVALQLADYRALFRRVGGPWLWFSRLVMDDERLAAILDHPMVELFAVRDGAATVGMLELDRRVSGACELAFVGLIPSYAGRGHGRWLLAEAVNRAWASGTTRVNVHTCTLDHPNALGAYRRAGFGATARAIETFTDPRLVGILPRGAAPHIPLVDPPPS